jgi:PAS domain S-box-containing protein
VTNFPLDRTRVGQTTLGDLATERHSLADTTACHEIDTWLRAHPDCRSVVLRRAGGELSLMNRSVFYEHLVGPSGSGWSLHSAEPVSRVRVPAAPWFEASTVALTAGMDLMRRGIPSDDDILVVGAGRGPGTVGVARLLGEVAQAHRLQAGRLEALFQDLPDVVLVVDVTGRIRCASSSLAKIWGRPTSEWVGRDSIGHLHPADRCRAREMLREASERPGETVSAKARLRTSGGNFVVIALTVTDRGDEPEVGGIVVTYRDITVEPAVATQLRHRGLLTP